MSNITMHEYKKKDLKNALVIVSFPTIGLISSIVTNFIVSKMKLELIASFISDDFSEPGVTLGCSHFDALFKRFQRNI